MQRLNLDLKVSRLTVTSVPDAGSPVTTNGTSTVIFSPR